jgi:hypothetical protein
MVSILGRVHFMIPTREPAAEEIIGRTFSMLIRSVRTPNNGSPPWLAVYRSPDEEKAGVAFQDSAIENRIVLAGLKEAGTLTMAGF